MSNEPAPAADVMSTTPPAGGLPQDRPLNMRVVLRLGKEYLGRHKFLVLLYIVLYFAVQTLIPLGVATFASRVTNDLQTSPPSSTVADPAAASPFATTPADPALQAPTTVSERRLITAYSFWVLLTIVLLGAGFAHSYLSAALADKTANDIRKDLFDSLLGRPSQFFHKHNADELTMVVNQFSTQVQTALQSLIIDPVLNLVGMIVLGFSLYRALTSGEQAGPLLYILFGVIVLIAMASPWLVSVMGRKLQKSASDLQQQGLLIQSLVGGALKAPEEIQAMRAEPIFSRKHADALNDSLKRRLRQTATIETLNTTGQLPGNLVLIGLLGAAVFMAVSGSGTNSGVVILLFTLTPQFMGAVQRLSGLSISASMNWPAVDMVNTLLSSDERPQSTSDGGAAPKDLPPTMEARNIVFRYPGADKIVLNGVSFVVPPGKVSGFVAKAGQGKTTFFRLALRFYEPLSGEILIGGERHTSLPVSTLRQHVVLMHQAPAFFHDTIRENFLIANPAATDADIQALCEKTPLWKILNNAYGANPLDQQFVAGNYLSGGQKKLFAITRCLLRNPTILLLDEPTTGIDPSEKFELVSMMRQACAGRTVMVVDHDVVGWQVLFCDHIFVLNEGKLEQEGAPGDLLKRGGLFKELFDDQSEGFHRMSDAMKTADAQHLPPQAAAAAAEAATTA